VAEFLQRKDPRRSKYQIASASAVKLHSQSTSTIEGLMTQYTANSVRARQPQVMSAFWPYGYHCGPRYSQWCLILRYRPVQLHCCLIIRRGQAGSPCQETIDRVNPSPPPDPWADLQRVEPIRYDAWHIHVITDDRITAPGQIWSFTIKPPTQDCRV